jgi:antitoxin component YwqK of YwqJK toxin-antitoxin module
MLENMELELIQTGISVPFSTAATSTTGDFNVTSSWITFDAGKHGVGTDPDGYDGAVFDGRYVYFVPYYNGSDYHGEVLRYDTTGDFVETSSWITFDAGEHGVGTDPDGYIGAVFDGRYVYFVPYYNGSDRHGEVLKYDTTGDFNVTSSWITFDPGGHGVGTDPDGYRYAVFDGRYVYFVPYHNGSDYHGEVLRYDTMGNWEENPDPQDPYSQGDQSDVSGTSADPVNTATGSFFHQQTDLSITGRGSPLIFKRYYNSKAAAQERKAHIFEGAGDNDIPTSEGTLEQVDSNEQQTATSTCDTLLGTKEESE